MMDSIVEAVFTHAEKTPDKLCLADDTGSVSYCAYADKISATAAALAALNVAEGSAVVVEASQTIGYLAVELALHLLKAVFVPVERNCAHEKIVDLALQTDAALILTNAPLEESAGIRAMTLEQLHASCGPNGAGQAWAFPERDTVSEILFSTGTTGKEKGIILNHGNDVALAENVIYGVEMQDDNVEMIPSPMNHSHGLRRYYANMWKGASVVLLGSIMDLRRFFANMETYGVNSLDLVPSALSVLLRLSKEKLGEYSDVIRYVQLGSAPLMKADNEKLCRLLPKTRVYNFYGSTESGCICIYDINRPEPKESCIGKPAHNAEIVIVDDDRNPITSDADHTGLLSSKGGMNMVGYYKDPEETEKALRNGTVYSNDIAYVDGDGDIILLGRKGSVINIGGKKVSPDEIEDAAKKIKGVTDSACIPVSDPIKGNVPKLFVVMARGKAFDPVSIREQLSELLEPFKVPKFIEQIDQVPRTFNGKILRRELK